MWRVAISTGYIITPVLASFEVIVLFFSCVALKACFGDLFRGFIFESSNLCLIAAALYVSFAGAMTRFATLPLGLPTGFSKRGVEGF